MRVSPDRDQTIDAFRGLAIIAVMLFHYLVRWEYPVADEATIGLSQDYPQFLGLGRLGVQLFFVVSGLVITMTVLRSKDVVDFAAKRFSRLYPPFIFAVFLTAAVLSLHDPMNLGVSPKDFLINLTMLAGQLDAEYVDGVYWSLVPELYFYGWTALAWMTLGNRFWIGLIGVGVVGLILGPHSGLVASLTLYNQLPFFLTGIALWFFLIGWRQQALILMLGASIFYVLTVRLYETGTAEWVAHAAIIGAVSALAFFLIFKRGQQWGPLAWLGRISYSFYLIHQNLGVTALHTLKRYNVPDIVAVMLVSVLAVIAAWAMFKVVEEGGKRLSMHLYHKARSRFLQPRPA